MGIYDRDWRTLSTMSSCTSLQRFATFRKPEFSGFRKAELYTHEGSELQVERFSHHAYSAFCTRVGLSERRIPVVRVQVMRHRVVLCGRVLELASSDRGEWFKVETAIGHFWVESRHVRLCSGDGRCACEVSA